MQVLFMKKPEDEDGGGGEEVDWSQAHHELLQHANPYSKRPRRPGPGVQGGDSLQGSAASISVSQLDISRLCQQCGDRQQAGHSHPRSPFTSPNALKGIQGIAYIAKHFSETDQASRVRLFISSYM